MMNVGRLKALWESSTDKYGDAEKIGTTYQTMYNIIYKERPFKVDLLEKIAKLLMNGGRLMALKSLLIV